MTFLIIVVFLVVIIVLWGRIKRLEETVKEIKLSLQPPWEKGTLVQKVLDKKWTII